MDEQFFIHEYRTGNTHPRKSHSGMVAVLLMCVIFLAGVVSAMGVLNIRLFRKLEQLTREKEAFVSFFEGDGISSAGVEVDQSLCREVQGITFQELPLLYRQMYGLPQGLYVSQVEEGSPGEKAGIVPGDVLLMADGVETHQLDQLEEVLEACGETAVLTLCRDGQQRKCTLPLEE